MDALLVIGYLAGTHLLAVVVDALVAGPDRAAPTVPDGPATPRSHAYTPAEVADILIRELETADRE